MQLDEIADRFAEERIRLGYNRVAFARLLGISTEGLRLIEAGQSEFKVTVLTSAASTGVDVQYILTGVRSQNTKAVTDQIGYEKQAVTGEISGVGIAQTGANVQINTNHITTEKVINRTVAVTKPGEEHISLSQRSILKELVDQVAEKEGILKKNPKTHRAIWASLNKHCSVNTYTLIASSDFEKARKYLHMWLGRLNAAPSASVKDGDSWRKQRYKYIKVNSKDTDDAAALTLYMSRNFNGATSLTQLSDDELDRIYRYVAGRRSKKR